MSDRSSPEMSVVIVTPDRYEIIRKTIEHLRAQTARDQLEIVIVAPSAGNLGLDDSELQDFLQVCVVEVGAIASSAEARAAGTRQATAPVVAFVEDHSYPDPGWAEALIEAHKKPWGAVGPVIRNANPDSVISRAFSIMDHVAWIEPAVAGEIDDLPGHNSSYKRAILLDYGSNLGAMLEAESVLHWDLQARGYRLYLESAAKTYHLNPSSPSSFVRELFHYARLFAAARARNWSPLRRLLYTGGAPLIPAVRFWRILRQLRRSGQQRNLPLGVLPPLILGLVVSAVGEMIGYALGAGDANQKLSNFEFHRV